MKFIFMGIIEEGVEIIYCFVTKMCILGYKTTYNNPKHIFIQNNT